MKQRPLLWAIALGVLGAALLVAYMRQFEREMSGGDRVELIMAVKPFERGTVIKEDMLATRAVPVAYVEDRAIKAHERSKILGLPAAGPVRAGQVILWTDLAVTTEARDLSSLVQPGKRAVTVRASGTDDSRGAGLIQPGDYVDVIMTGSAEGHEEQSSAVLLQRILVLAVGADTQPSGGADGKPRDSYRDRDNLLTLSLSLAEAQLIALAKERGRLTVALRTAEDPSVQADIPDLKASALLDTTARGEAQRPGRAPNNTPFKIAPQSL